MALFGILSFQHGTIFIELKINPEKFRFLAVAVPATIKKASPKNTIIHDSNFIIYLFYARKF